MQPKQSTPISVISLSKKATLKTIVEDIGNLPEDVMADVAASGLEPDGPMIFVYRNCSCDMDQPFDLELAQPVKSVADYQGKLQVNTLEPIHYLQRTYKGSLEQLGAKGYEPFIADIQEAGIQMTDQCREIYTNFEGYSSDNNVTEIQMGVVVE